MTKEISAVNPFWQTIHQLFRYTLVGGLAFVVDFAALYIFTEYFRLHYLISATISFSLGLIVNYLLSTLWVFEHRAVKQKSIEFLIFTVIGIMGLLLNDILMWLGTDILRIHYLNSKLAAAVLVYLWNFFVRKFTLFV